jgi:hypothetical protein
MEQHRFDSAWFDGNRPAPAAKGAAKKPTYRLQDLGTLGGDNKPYAQTVAPNLPSATQVYQGGIGSFGMLQQPTAGAEGRAQGVASNNESLQRYQERAQQQATTNAAVQVGQGVQGTLERPYAGKLEFGRLRAEIASRESRQSNLNARPPSDRDQSRPMVPQTTFDAYAAPSSSASAAPVDSSKTIRGDIPVAPKVATGLASLDFDLPEGGVLYSFTMPRGDARVSARAVPAELPQRGGELAIVAAAALVLWIFGRSIARGRFAWLATMGGAAVLVVLGLLSLLIGIFPVVGLIAILVGGGFVIRASVRTAR